MIPATDCYVHAREALAFTVGDSIALTTELDERHLISWGNLPLPPPHRPWLGGDLVKALDEPVQHYKELQQEWGRYLWRCSIGLHPDEAGLSDDQWTAVAHRILHAAGITDVTALDPPVRWVALRDGGRALHIIASLVREPDHSSLITPAANASAAIAAECTRLTGELLHPHGIPLTTLASRISQANGPDELAALIATVTDEQHGTLSQLRCFTESAAHWSAAHNDAAIQDAGHRLTWAARRLHDLQRDLAGIATDLCDTRPTSPRRARPADQAAATPLKFTPRPRSR
ncbi:hypothetical protein ACWCXK_05935 [Streptomyces sp. NPDC001739]